MKHVTQRIVSTVIALALLVAIIPAVGFIGTALGWTNPVGTPPTGSGAISYVSGNVGINTASPTTAMLVVNAPGATGIDVDPTGAASGHIVGLTASPSANDEAASKAYVDAQVGGGPGGSGGGSLVLYYKTVSNVVVPPPTCPSGWTTQYTGYGPHYLGVFAHDWLNGGTGGTGGGFLPGGGTSVPPGSTYILRSVAIGSDSVCSQDQTSKVPFNSIFNNQLSVAVSAMDADACFTDTTVNPNVTECNRCIVCQK